MHEKEGFAVETTRFEPTYEELKRLKLAGKTYYKPEF